ncbi:hypothetical protein [Ethanoligenens sp.]|uniref:hypothetical protein n=1 Tax=Ethanoligenens sp. TaxID=2099655 RepID=UPI0039EA24F4
MELNISEILSDTLAEMEQTGEVEKHVKDVFRKAVFSAVDGVLDGYKLRQSIEDRLEEKLPEIVTDIGLDGYMEFVAQAAKSIVESVQGEELRKRAQAAMENMLLKKRKSIKVSEIIAAFAEECKDQDEDMRRDHPEFEVEIKNERQTYSIDYYSFNLKLMWNGNDNWDRITASFGMLYKRGKPSNIAHLDINGENQNGKIGIRRLSKFEALILSCYYNNTPVEIDMTDPDDVDTCVYEEDY